MMQVHNISYRAGDRRILDDISFAIQPGHITVVLGPNGAGKSTLLRILSGELLPQEGYILFNGRHMHTLSAVQLARRRAVLTQQYAVNLPFSCEEVVMMGRYPHFGNTPSITDQHIVAAAMEDMQVMHLQGRPFHTLSGGEQQRVQVARILAQLWTQEQDPQQQKLLLLDEPTSSMDVLHQQLLLTKARQLAQQQYAVLIVLHDLNLAAQFADQVVLLRKGQLMAAGDVDTVLHPDPIREAYGIAVDIVRHDDYAFPVLVPAAHKRKGGI